MRRTGFHIGGQTHYGIEFKAKTPDGKESIFFYAPDDHVLYKSFAESRGRRGWHQLPIERLPDGKRSKLLDFWHQRSAV
jgi:hypothetical protein